MLKMSAKLMILLIFYTIALTMGLKDAKARMIDEKEIFLKSVSSRISTLLRENNEAQTFLGEDLSEALNVFDTANIEWSDSAGSWPLLISEETKRKIFLTKYFSIINTAEETISSTLTLLFQIQRQLDASLMPVPSLRVKLFSKKFSPILFGEGRSCSVSLYPITIPLNTTQREKFVSKLLSLLDKKGYGYSSKSPAHVLWINSKLSSDHNGKNALDIKLKFLEVSSRQSQELAQAKTFSSGYKFNDLDSALNKLVRDLTTNLPECNNTFGYN